MRNVKILRETAETKISLQLELDGTGKTDIATGCGFLDHMLTLLASHGHFDLSVQGSGDIDVDYHHLTEDVGIVLGQAFRKALGDKKGIQRYGDIVIPMDEALILCAIDFSGRCFLDWRVDLPTEKVGDFDTELGEEFWYGFVRNSESSLHFQMLAGRNSHHILEACFKAAGRVLRQACRIEEGFEDLIPSSKGVL